MCYIKIAIYIIVPAKVPLFASEYGYVLVSRSSMFPSRHCISVLAFLINFSSHFRLYKWWELGAPSGSSPYSILRVNREEARTKSRYEVLHKPWL
jgi:hypothetical protein